MRPWARGARLAHPTEGGKSHAVWHIPGDSRFSGDYSGRDAILGRFQTMAEAGATTKLEEIHDIVGNEDQSEIDRVIG